MTLRRLSSSPFSGSAANHPLAGRSRGDGWSCGAGQAVALGRGQGWLEPLAAVAAVCQSHAGRRLRLAPPSSSRIAGVRDPLADGSQAALDATVSAGGDPAESVEEDPLVRRRRVEAVLLLHRGPVHLRKLASLAQLADATEARTRIRELNELYRQTGSALRVEEVAGGHQLLTRPGLAPWLRRIRHVPPPVQLGEAALETLAVIAYRQPVLRADIEAIRGVACGELIRQLMSRDLVRIAGRSEELGRPYLYGTTSSFLEIFGLKNLGSIPALPGSTIPDDSEDTLANPDNPGKAVVADSPIEATMKSDHLVSHPSPFDVVTTKESDVSTAPGPVVLDEVAIFLDTDSPVAVADRPALRPSGPAAMSDDDDDDYYDDEDDDEDDDGLDDDWVDDDDSDEDDDDDDDGSWEVVGDDDEDEDDEDDEEDDDDQGIDDDDDEDDDDWDDEDDDWDDDDDDEDDEWD